MEDLEITKSVTLQPAAGREPVIGDLGAERNLDVDTEGPRALTVTLRGIEFRNVAIDVRLDQGSGHRFVLEDSTVEDDRIGDSSGNTGVNVDGERPGTVAIRRNEIASLGDSLEVRAEPTEGVFEAEITNNRITTTDAPAGVAPNDSHSGINLDLDGAGRGEIDVYSNLVYGVAGCNCGGASAIDIRGAPIDGTVNLVGNTVDDAQFSSEALDVVDDNPGSLTVRAFNNIFSNASDAVVDFPASDSGLTIVHDFNDVYDPGDPPDYDGYPPGSNSDAQDPLYVDAAAADYHLQATSPQKQQGLVCPPGGQSATDLAGNDRVERVSGPGGLLHARGVRVRPGSPHRRTFPRRRRRRRRRRRAGRRLLHLRRERHRQRRRRGRRRLRRGGRRCDRRRHRGRLPRRRGRHGHHRRRRRRRLHVRRRRLRRDRGA